MLGSRTTRSPLDDHAEYSADGLLILAAAVLYGMGYGAYIAVDQALITQVLPKAHDRAKDLGIINIAIVCPGAIGAAIAAPLVSLAGYPTLFGATAVVAIGASIGVWQIKSVR